MNQHVPYLSIESLVGTHRVADPRDLARPLLPFFPRAQHDGKLLAARTRRRTPGDNRFVDFGAKAAPVRRGTLEGRLYVPMAIRLTDNVKADEVAFFASVDEAVAKGTATRDIIAEADRRLMSLVSDLTDDAREMRHVLCAGALQGGYTFSQDGADNTVDFGLHTLTAPGTSWAAAGATIVANIRAWLEEFQDYSDGHPVTHAFYNPGINSAYLTKNTEWLGFLQKVPSLAAGFLGQVGGGGSDPGVTLNDFVTGAFKDALFGITWVPIRGKYLKHSTGTMTDRWPVTKLTFASLGTDTNEVLSWGMVKDAYNPSPEVRFDRIDTKDPLGAQLLAYDNGGALILRPERVQTVATLTPGA